MEKVKQYILLIEIGIVVLLLIFLNIGGNDETKKINDKVLKTEHEAPDSGSSLPIGGENPAGTGDKPGPNEGKEPTPSVTEPENPLEGYPEEVIDAYNQAMELKVPEGIAFADVQESMSIRVSPDGESRQVGIMYPMNACIVHSVDGEWAKITSGSVEGYCRVKYLIRGEEAAEMATGLVVRTAVTTANVNIRRTATTLEDNVIRTVEAGVLFRVITPAVLTKDPDAPLFVEVTDGEQTAYIAIGKVKLSNDWTYGKAI